MVGISRGSGTKQGTMTNSDIGRQPSFKGGDSLRIMLVIALVGGVLASHVHSRSSMDLSPWKGGGFGMFSTIDSPGDRLLRTTIHTDIGPINIAAPQDLGDDVSTVLAAPSEQHIEDLAFKLANQTWVTQKPDFDSVMTPADATAADAMADALALFVESSTVQAIDDASFDPNRHHRVQVDEAVVTVYRLEPDGNTSFRPVKLAGGSALAVPGGDLS